MGMCILYTNYIHTIHNIVQLYVHTVLVQSIFLPLYNLLALIVYIKIQAISSENMHVHIHVHGRENTLAQVQYTYIHVHMHNSAVMLSL